MSCGRELVTCYSFLPPSQPGTVSLYQEPLSKVGHLMNFKVFC